jgi:hypothetical protein
MINISCTIDPNRHAIHYLNHGNVPKIETFLRIYASWIFSNEDLIFREKINNRFRTGDIWYWNVYKKTNIKEEDNSNIRHINIQYIIIIGFDGDITKQLTIVEKWRQRNIHEITCYR